MAWKNNNFIIIHISQQLRQYQIYPPPPRNTHTHTTNTHLHTTREWYKEQCMLPWITIFGSRVRRFANNFREWRSHEWKSLANRITSDPKIVIGNECIILFLTRYLMSWTNNYRSLISSLSLWTVFSDLELWRHHRWYVTSRECRTLALWRHIRWSFLHAQIGAKAIFTSE